jgi:flagellar protein FliO/FliZ
MNSMLTSLLTAGAALVAVLGMIWLAARLARASRLVTRAGSSRTLAVRDVLHLDGRRRLYVVGCQNRAVLLLTGGTNDVVVGWLPAGETPSGPETAP